MLSVIHTQKLTIFITAMAKLRTNHKPQGRGGIGGLRTLILVALLGALLLASKFYPSLVNDLLTVTTVQEMQVEEKEVATYTEEELYFLPTIKEGTIVKHKHFALSYVEKYEVAEWVAYELTRNQLKQNRVPRADNFLPDQVVATSSADTYDYRGSGYDRGHLIPAADRAFSREAMDETFLMSNITPQDRSFNGGIWRELEELVRDWAYKFNKLYIVTGPVLTQPIKGTIGKNKVAVPSAFYKVILDISEPELKAIAFIIPNELSNQPLQDFATSIDQVEQQTGIDFFGDLLEDKLETELEKDFEVALWEFDESKFRKRVAEWNKNMSGNLILSLSRFSAFKFVSV